MGGARGAGSGEENWVIVQEAKFIKELGQKTVRETGRRAYGVGAIEGFWGFEAAAVGGGKKLWGCTAVKVWLSQEADPESETCNQDTCQIGLGSTPGDGSRIEQRKTSYSTVTGKTLADFEGILKVG